MRRFYAVLALVLVLVGSVHAQERDWLLTFYADREDLLGHLHLGYFETIEDCQIAGLRLMQRFSNATYSCSLACRPMNPDGGDEGLSVCSQVYREWTGLIH